MLPPPRLFDTHAHLDEPRLARDLDDLWASARAAGVTRALAVGLEPSSWQQTAALQQRLPGVSVALGIHPQLVPTLSDEQVREGLARLPFELEAHGAVCLGECGLDGPSLDLERQEHVLRSQLAIARELRLPISLHVFRVHQRALELLRREPRLTAGGVVHSYSGPAELVAPYVALGFSISFAGSITRSNARKPLLAARAVPADRLLIETDAPFQPAGVDARDRSRGVPADLLTIARAVAQAREIEVGELGELTTANAERLFPVRAQGKNRIG